jgi:pentatricopeptide repeat protein
LLDACVKNNRLDLALLLFDRIKQDKIELNTILYTTLIKGLSKVNKVTEASELFNLMKKNSKTYPNLITYNCMIDAYVRISDIEKANATFYELENEKKLKPDLISYSTLIKGFCKIGDAEKIYFLFEKMIKKNVMADEPLVNVCMEACFNGKKSELGVRIFDRMIATEFRPSAVTFSIAIKVI